MISKKLTFPKTFSIRNHLEFCSTRYKICSQDDLFLEENLPRKKLAIKIQVSLFVIQINKFVKAV